MATLREKVEEAIICINDCKMSEHESINYLTKHVLEIMENALKSSQLHSLSLDDKEDRELFIHRLERVKTF
jgi:hypothetical protein